MATIISAVHEELFSGIIFVKQEGEKKAGRQGLIRKYIVPNLLCVIIGNVTVVCILFEIFCQILHSASDCSVWIKKQAKPNAKPVCLRWSLIPSLLSANGEESPCADN